MTLDEVNERFCLVGVGAQTVVAEEVIRRDGTREYSEFLLRSIPDFKNKLIKESIRVRNGEGELTTKPLANVWLKHQRGRQYDQLVYLPPGSGLTLGPRDLNGWKGLTVTPQAGSWSRTQEFIWTIVCQQDRTLYDWLLDWMAALFQRPGQHADTAIVATGHEGTGKNFFADTVIGRCFDARHARVTTHVRQVLGEFNAILSGLCVLVLDEAGLATDNDARALRGLVTGHTIDINRKGIDVGRERSMLHVLVLSNDSTPLKVAAEDRRFAFCAFSNARQRDTAYFEAIDRELDHDGGRAAMLHDLLARPVDWNRLRTAPNTKAKQRAKRDSWTDATWFFFRLLREVGSDAWANHHQLRRIKKADTVVAYHDYLKLTNSRREVKDARLELHVGLKKLVPAGWDFNRPVREDSVGSRDYWTLPDWQTFAASFAQAVGCELDDILTDEQSRATQQSLTADERHFADADEPASLREEM